MKENSVRALCVICDLINIEFINRRFNINEMKCTFYYTRNGCTKWVQVQYVQVIRNGFVKILCFPFLYVM